jgi:hypothetical protein
MSAPLPTTQLLAFRDAEVKPGQLVVPVLLASGEWAGLSASPAVWRKLGGIVDTALDKLSARRTADAPAPSPAINPL